MAFDERALHGLRGFHLGERELLGGADAHDELHVRREKLGDRLVQPLARDHGKAVRPQRRHRCYLGLTVRVRSRCSVAVGRPISICDAVHAGRELAVHGLTRSLVLVGAVGARAVVVQHELLHGPPRYTQREGRDPEDAHFGVRAPLETRLAILFDPGDFFRIDVLRAHEQHARFREPDQDAGE